MAITHGMSRHYGKAHRFLMYSGRHYRFMEAADFFPDGPNSIFLLEARLAQGWSSGKKSVAT